MKFYSILDLVLIPVYLLVIFISAKLYAGGKKISDPDYQYFLPGLTFKIIGGLGLAFVYTFYYPGGDTTMYFYNAKTLYNLADYDFNTFLKVFNSEASPQLNYFFNSETGYPTYTREPRAWMVVKITLVLMSFSFHSFYVTSLICAVISFSGIWKLYRVFTYEFPHLRKEMAIAFFFIPSVFFWGSGLLKDTFTMGALGYLISGLHYLLVRKTNKIISVFYILIGSYIILGIKPYILVGLIPAIILWLVQMNLHKIKVKTVRAITFPILVIVGVGFGYLMMQILGDSLAEYKLETVLEKAKVTQRDLKSEYYMGNSFDIGEFESTIPSILSKFPIATFSAFFRPLIFEANNIVMFLSGIENLVLLLFTIRILISIRFIGIFNYFFRHHILTFSIFFALFFAFSVGLSTSNFGTLVRYKIPSIPFFVASLILINDLRKKDDSEKPGDTA